MNERAKRGERGIERDTERKRKKREIKEGGRKRERSGKSALYIRCFRCWTKPESRPVLNRRKQNLLLMSKTTTILRSHFEEVPFWTFTI